MSEYCVSCKHCSVVGDKNYCEAFGDFSMYCDIFDDYCGYVHVCSMRESEE